MLCFTRSCRSSICPGHLSTAWLVSLVVIFVIWSPGGDTRGPSVVVDTVDMPSAQNHFISCCFYKIYFRLFFYIFTHCLLPCFYGNLVCISCMIAQIALVTLMRVWILQPVRLLRFNSIQNSLFSTQNIVITTLFSCM